jgi:phage tail protein X
MAERTYTTIEEDALDLIAFREYGMSSETTEVLFDVNYRIADNPILMPAGIVVALPPQNPKALRQVIRLWDLVI